MKLTGTQRDTLHSLVITQNVSGALKFVEGLLGGENEGPSGIQSGAVKDPIGGLQQESGGSDSGKQDSARKRSGKES